MHRSLRIAAAVLTVATSAGAFGPRMSAQTGASSAKTVRVTGLTHPVDIFRDRWGINHIYAGNEHDLFFAQGYAAARDRLFQFEIWRRQATGTVSQILGRRELQRDIGNRLFSYRGDLTQELNWYHPHGLGRRGGACLRGHPGPEGAGRSGDDEKGRCNLRRSMHRKTSLTCA